MLAACASQAQYCERLGSPFTARICRLLAIYILPQTELGRELLAWPGDPRPEADSLPLRITGALHFLARAGKAGLNELYPPAVAADAQLAVAVRDAFSSEQSFLRAFVQRAPQTNEVGRSAALMAGLLAIAARTRLPLALYEIGASAGLNLLLDRYQFRFGAVSYGDPQSELMLAPRWEGPVPPVDAPLRIARRAGGDIAPIDIGQQSERARLLAYVWPDQTVRLARLAKALEIARLAPPPVDRADAADWLREKLAVQTAAGETRVLMHSVVWGYLSRATQAGVESHMEKCAAAATPNTPLAWLTFELDPQQRWPNIRLRLWPGSIDVTLGHSHAHGDEVKWLAS